MRKVFCVLAAVWPLVPAFADDTPPAWLQPGPHAAYDGITDDLVTGGLGSRGMLGGKPGYADPLHPTAAELRRASLHQKGSAGQGFGRLFGPNVDPATGATLPDDGKVAGDEYLAYERQPGAANPVAAMLLQVPASVSKDRRCIVAIPVNGSSSLYRDVVDFGYWGLHRGCAVAYTDKGHGDGFDILESGGVNLVDGRAASAASAGRDAHFRADLDDEARGRFLAAWPHRVAFKAAFSKQNPEKDWGDDVLYAVRFAFWQMQRRDPGFTRQNTLVIVTGSSNGGGAALYAGEKDRDHLIDGIEAREPQVQMRPDDRVAVRAGGTTRRGSGRTLLDYFSFGNLYQPCAALAVPDIPLRDRIGFAPNRCTSLHEKGLLDSDTPDGQAREALSRMHDYGWSPETDVGHAFGYVIAPDATSTKYVNDHGRFDPRDRVCGYSYAAVDADGRPMAVPPDQAAQIFAIAPGGTPAGSIDTINDADPTGPRRSWVSTSASTGRQDYDLDGAMCIRDLVTGDTPDGRRVRAGIDEFLASARLAGMPAIIVHGRSDDRVPVAFSSRPYLGLNALADGADSRLRYVEVTNAEHFGTDVPGFDTRMVPLVVYHLRALELMWAHLTEGQPLPASQVVHTTPRGGIPGRAPPLTEADVPPIRIAPPPDSRISVDHGAVMIPD